jgi:RNA polymerase subunit RPABC4/transcription elongation factor Spt4
MKCVQCQNVLNPDFKFCPFCGTSAKLACYHCGKDINAEWISCPHCGTKLKEPHTAIPNTPPQSPQYPTPSPHRSGHYSDSSSGRHHRRKKGLFERFFS